MQKDLAVADEGKRSFAGQLTAFGELLGTAWEYKKRMSPKITTPVIDEAYAEALAHGAIGGKITGAGGGGFMLFYCRPGRAPSRGRAPPATCALKETAVRV